MNGSMGLLMHLTRSHGIVLVLVFARGSLLFPLPLLIVCLDPSHLPLILRPTGQVMHMTIEEESSEDECGEEDEEEESQLKPEGRGG